jgi:hypothetical protein
MKNSLYYRFNVVSCLLIQPTCISREPVSRYGDGLSLVTSMTERNKGKTCPKNLPSHGGLYHIYGKNMHLLISTGE